MKKRQFILLLCMTCVLMAGLFYWAHIDDAAGRRSLSALTQGVMFVSNVGQTIVARLEFFLSWSVIVSIGVILMLAIQRRSASHALFFVGLAVALLTQFILIDQIAREKIGLYLRLPQSPSLSVYIAACTGIVGYTVALLFVLLAFKSPMAPDFDAVQENSHKSYKSDFFILLIIIALGSLFRIYGLNHHLNFFEGELAIYSAGATSLKGIFYANRGYNGPWAPLGLLYYLPIYVTTSVFGTTLLALRLSSALVGIVTIPLCYLLAHRIAGRAAGLVAAALFALNCLHIGWSRTDIHPHGVTTWPTLLMCFFLLQAAETKKLRWALGVACMMGLCWHQYPSGQSAVAIPLIALGFFFVFNRGSFPLRTGQIIIIACGVILWFLGLPLSYYPVIGEIRWLNPFTLTGPRALWGTDGPVVSSWQMVSFVLIKTMRHFLDFTQGVFYHVPYLFHQEWIPATGFLQARSVPWFVVSLAMTALSVLIAQRKRFETAVLFGWLVAAILPGILSEHAYPKRLSTVFPLFDILAGISCAFVFAYLNRCRHVIGSILCKVMVVATIAILTAHLTFVWFSGIFFHYDPPPEIAMARELESTVRPRTLVIGGLGGGYELGKFLYLMVDFFADPANRPNLFVAMSNPELRRFLSETSITQEYITMSVPYSWTKLRNQLAESLAIKDWDYVTFFIVEYIHNSSLSPNEIEAALSSCPNPIVRHVDSAANSPDWKLLTIVSISCAVRDMTKPPAINS